MALTAILPCNDLDVSEAFYRRLGFARVDDSQANESYRILKDHSGVTLHLNQAVEGWLIPGQNPFGLYLQTENVDGLATVFAEETIEKKGPENKPWGMYEFSLSDPDDTLVRVGWPTHMRKAAERAR